MVQYISTFSVMECEQECIFSLFKTNDIIDRDFSITSGGKNVLILITVNNNCSY